MYHFRTVRSLRLQRCHRKCRHPGQRLLLIRRAISQCNFHRCTSKWTSRGGPCMRSGLQWSRRGRKTMHASRLQGRSMLAGRNQSHASRHRQHDWYASESGSWSRNDALMLFLLINFPAFTINNSTRPEHNKRRTFRLSFFSLPSSSASPGLTLPVVPNGGKTRQVWPRRWA